MDFVEGLPTSHGKNVILVMVDRLTKYAHFVAIAHPYTAKLVASVFANQIFRLYGAPKAIVSDRDPVFTSQFWTEFMKLNGVQLKLSTAFHPQTDGQSEVVNRCLENYLRSYCFHEPHQWSHWLCWAEHWYITTWHSSTKLTPYQALYERPPPHILSYIPHTAKV